MNLDSPLLEDEMPQFDRLRNIRKLVNPNIQKLQAVWGSVKDATTSTAGQARGLWRDGVSLSKNKAKALAASHNLTPTYISPDVFNLQGERYTICGSDSEGSSSEETSKLQLHVGALVGHFKHSGDGEFTVALARSDGGFEVMGADAGEGDWIGAWQVKGSWLGRLRPGKSRDGWLSQVNPGGYRLKVEASGNWSFRLIQLALNQSPSGIPYRCEGAAGSQVAGPFKVGSHPLRVRAQHDGGGSFLVRLISLDGTDERDVVKEEGQTHLEEHPIEAMPGKEYLLFAKAGGTWELEFTEGY